MSETAEIRFAVDRSLLENAERVVQALGLSMPSVFDLLLRQLVIQARLPFTLRAPASATTPSATVTARRDFAKPVATATTADEDF